MRRLLLATTNRGKQDELRRLLGSLDAELVVPDDLGLDIAVDEPHATYAENARAKAVAYASASGELAIADDSGIEIAHLGWGPGVRSARWGDGRNADRVLEALAGIRDRRARMVCVVAIAGPGIEEAETFEGVVHGRIAERARGHGGFGYDPVFLVDGRTTAEMDEARKDELSHRGQAIRAALPRLRLLTAGD